MSDEPILDEDQVRSMWRRLASSPYITEEERISFTLRAHSVANTSGESGRRLNAAIERERERRRSGVTTVTTLPPHAPQTRLDREEQEQLAINALPPGLCVAHSLNTATYITAASHPLPWPGTNINTIPGFQFRDVSWDRLPPPQKANANVTELAKLLGAIFNGGVTAISFSQTAESPRTKLNVEISIPADITYDDFMANLQRLAGEHKSAKLPSTPGRRRLLKLEENT